MILKKLLCLFTAFAMLLFGTVVFAEVAGEEDQGPLLYSDDGLISIRVPTAEWDRLNGTTDWFAITNGTDLITVNRLIPGDPLPEEPVADEVYSAVCHTFLSTGSEVLDIRGFAASLENMAVIQEIIATITIDPGFMVYGEDGAAVRVTPTDNQAYTDSRGHIYTLQPDGLYRRTDFGTLYSVDPDHWGRSNRTEAANGKPFTVYGEDETTVSIYYYTAAGYYRDANGDSYDKLGDGLYCNNRTNMLYSTDANHWGSKSGSEKQDGDAFTVYAENGAKVSIYPTVGGYYMDERGGSYDLTSDGLYRNRNTERLYAADAKYWENKQTEATEADKAQDNTAQEEKTTDETIKSEDAKNENTKEETSKEETKQEETSKEETSQDGSAQEESSKTEDKQEEAAQEETKQGETSKEEASQGESAQEGSGKTEDKQEEAAQEETKQEETSKEETSKEETSKEETSTDESAQEGSGKTEDKQEEAAQEETKQEETSKEEASQGESAQEETGKTEDKQEESAQEETRQEESGQKETKQEESEQKETKQEESAQNESVRSESAQTETQTETKQESSSEQASE